MKIMIKLCRAVVSFIKIEVWQRRLQNYRDSKAETIITNVPKSKSGCLLPGRYCQKAESMLRRLGILSRLPPEHCAQMS